MAKDGKNNLAETSSTEKRNDVDVERRSWLTWLMWLWTLLFLPVYCKSSRKNLRTAVKKKNPIKENEEQADANDLDGFGQFGDEEEKNTCDQRIEVDLTAYQEVTEALETKLFAYGDLQSAMLVISLPKYQHGLLDSIIIIAQPSGKVLAQKGIRAADINEDTTLRPIVIDNLNMKTDTKIALLYKLICNNCQTPFDYKKYEVKEDLKFSDTFRGQPVKSVTPISIPADYFKNQITPSIWRKQDNDGFFEGDKYSVAQQSAEFESLGFEDCYITDFVGEILSFPGIPFNDFTKHQEFICYKKVSDSFYVRTFIRLI